MSAGGKAVRLRCAEPEDLSILAAMAEEDLEVRVILEVGPGPRRRDLTAAVNAEEGGSPSMALVCESAGSPGAPSNMIGIALLRNIDWRSRRAQIAMLWAAGSLSADRMRAGNLFVRWVFRELNLFRLHAFVPVFCPEAPAVYGGLGFIEEGTLREHLYAGDRFINLQVLGLLRSDRYSGGARSDGGPVASPPEPEATLSAFAPGRGCDDEGPSFLPSARSGGIVVRDRRVALRRMEEEDLADVIRSAGGDLLRWSECSPLDSRAEREELLRAALRRARGAYPSELLLMIERRDGAVLGCVLLSALDWRNRRTDLEIYIGEGRYQNRGYGTEAGLSALRLAFRELNLHKVVARTAEGNERPARLATRCGRREAILRRHLYVDGAYRDVHLFGILRSEFDALEGELEGTRFARPSRTLPVLYGHAVAPRSSAAGAAAERDGGTAERSRS